MSRLRDTVVDVVVLVTLMTCVLTLLDDTFADRSYLVAAGAPVALLVAAALVFRGHHEGPWWYFLLSLAAFSPLGALAALREPGPWLVPTLDSISQVLVDSPHAPATLVGTVPPVAADGVVLLVPYLIAYLAMVPAAWLALTTSRPVAPALPVVAALAATIPLGVLVPALLVPRGIAVAVLLVVWGAIRARRPDPRRARRDPDRRTSTAGPVVTAALTVGVVAAVVSVLLPPIDPADRVLLRARGTGPDLSGAGASIFPAGGEQDVLLRATGVPDGRRLRFAVLDEYDGQEWVPAASSPGSDGYGSYKRIGAELVPLHPGRRTVVVRVSIRDGYASDWLPMLGELTSIDLSWNPGRTDVEDIRYNQATSSAIALGGVDRRDAYTFETTVTRDGFTRKDPTRDPADAQRQPAGAYLDDYLRPFAREELLPLERVLLLARYLRTQGTTRYEIDIDQSPAVLGRRMLGSRRVVGTPFQYAALVALGASRLGVAARVVTGADVGRRGVVRTTDITSWVELQFADGTWRTLDPERYVGERVAEGSDPPRAIDPGTFVRDEVAEASRGRDREIRPPEGSTNPDGTAAEPDRPAWQVALMVAAGLVALAVLALLLVPVAKVVRRRRRRRSTSWTGLYVLGWQEVLDAARDCGRPVGEGWGRVVQASGLGVDVELARRADAAVFAAGRPGDDGAEFWERCQDVRRQVVAAAPRRARSWSHLNPASLVAGWARRRRGTGARSGAA